jgi:tetratricopeptide (TPR) repeat protein
LAAGGWLRRWAPCWLAVLSGLWGLVGSAGPAAGQVADRVAPSDAYEAVFGDFYDGEYKLALDRFLATGRGAIRTSQSRWIDSICYETMCGECYYQMGLNSQALTHYTSALEIYLLFPNWLVQVNFPPQLRADPSLRKPIPWAARPPQAVPGFYPPRMPITQGQVTIGGLTPGLAPAAPPIMYPIKPQEILRCTALAIRRRAELLGPMASHDALFENLITALSRRPGPPNHWSEAWINLELGLALAAGGREGQAVTVLQHATLAAGEFLHPLSSTAHLAIGRLAMARGDYVAALQHLEEASYAAVYYPDPGVLEEAFRYGALTHLLANHQGMFPPLTPALAWAKLTHLRQLYVSLLLQAAENQLVLGQTAQAATLLEDARGAIGHRQMAGGRIGARRSFLAATALFQGRKLAEGEAALAAAMSFMRQGSLWMFHIGLVDKFYTDGGSGALAARTAIDLFQTVLRDPQPGDWSIDPLEALAVLNIPHPLVYEHWFEATLARREHELALEIADRARRHRFLTTLPLGGRLESLRWVLESPKERLPREALLQRQDLLAHYPACEQLRQEVLDLRKKLGGLPLVPDKPETLKEQTQELTQLATLGRQQEVLLREMAVRREPAALAFPPLRPTAEIQRSLPKGHALLVFFATSRGMHAFLLDHDRYADWAISLAQVPLGKQTAALLREMGNYQPNHEITLKDLADPKWKQTAHDLLDALLKGSRADFATKFDELIIVPDGLLWYLPFEALQVQADGRLQPLISRFRIRYAPTAGLAMAPAGWDRRQCNTAVVLGHLYPRLEDEAAQATFAELSRAVPSCVVLRSPLPAPSPIFANLLDRLVVLDDLAMGGEAGPYGWSPLPLDRNKAAGALADWLSLPWGGPQEIVLPGFHTAAEDALKKVGRAAPGNEIFLSVCGLMASGVRTILLSRWRSGGQSSLDLVREFTQELPHSTPADCWQRAVLVVAGSRLSLDAEPRVKRADADEPPRASHPFFWAGYLLVDCGNPAPGAPAGKP